MAKMIKFDLAGINYPALIHASYKSIDISRVGGDNTHVSEVTWGNFHNNNGKGFSSGGAIDSDSNSLRSMVTALKDLDANIARSFS